MESQGVGMADNLCMTTDGDRADVRTSQGDDRELIDPSDTTGTGDLGGDAAMNV